MESVAQEWAAPVNLGESWDRPAVPFHLVLHEAPDHLPALKTRLQRLDAGLPLLIRGCASEDGMNAW